MMSDDTAALVFVVVLIACCCAVLVWFWILDREKAKAYKLGLEDGKALPREADQEAFMRGVLWVQAADDAIEQAQRDRWRLEYERRMEPRKGAEERWP